MAGQPQANRKKRLMIGLATIVGVAVAIALGVVYGGGKDSNKSSEANGVQTASAGSVAVPSAKDATPAAPVTSGKDNTPVTPPATNVDLAPPAPTTGDTTTIPPQQDSSDIIVSGVNDALQAGQNLTSMNGVANIFGGALSTLNSNQVRE